MISFSAKDYEVAVEFLELEEIIGQGQFGDVYRGIYKSPVSIVVNNPHSCFIYSTNRESRINLLSGSLFL